MSLKLTTIIILTPVFNTTQREHEVSVSEVSHDESDATELITKARSHVNLRHQWPGACRFHNQPNHVPKSIQ